MTDKQRQIVDEAVAIELHDAASVGAVGFAARVWTQLALPYRDPGEVTRWERRNGNLTLVVRPATLVNRDGTTRDGFPFGVIPRYLLTWMATEAVRTQSPYLDMGSGLNEFAVKLGISKGGAGGRRLQDQIHRLVGATMQVQDIRRDDDGQRVSGQNFSIAESFDLWLPARDDAGEAQGALWNSTVTLSPQFFRSIIQAPVPVDLRALKALAGSPMQIDIYTWLTHRMSYLSSPTLIPWESLAAQFGGQFSRIRKFREVFEANLRAVGVLYPAARFEVTPAGLKLFPSIPHVGRKPRRTPIAT